jgi:hypothetical protein
MADRTSSEAVAAYKAILKRVLDNRPSGTRLKLAVALGKNRSFVSQITNTAYPVPIPAQHIETVFEVCHLSPAERAAFMEAYQAAHPRRAAALGATRATRIISVTVPDLGDARKNRMLDQLVAELAARLARFGEEMG